MNRPIAQEGWYRERRQKKPLKMGGADCRGQLAEGFGPVRGLSPCDVAT